MNAIIDWSAQRARMVLAFIVLSVGAGALAYVSLPKEGEPDIEIPALFVSVPFPGISAEDAEELLVRPMETELSGIDGLEAMSATAAEGYAGIAMEFEFGWDKTQVLADVRDAMQRAESQFPDGADSYSVNEINFSEFPILVVSLSGQVPERTLIELAQDMQDRIEAIDAVLEVGLTGQREEMLLVEIDPLKLEAYNVTAQELIAAVSNNNLLIAAGEIETDQGAFAVKIPSSFDDVADVYALPVRADGDRVVTLGDLSTIRLTFEDRQSFAQFNGESTFALQVVKKKGFNLIDTAAAVRAAVEAERATWPPELQSAVTTFVSSDQSRGVADMVSQLEGSVLTAIALVMIVVLASLGTRPALLVGFSIPTTFLLTFALMGIMGLTISNIVMFGLILAVGMLVDGGIVVVEYADKKISEGEPPMTAYVDAAKRMFWPVVSSTATTLCAFLPMLFWPGVAGEFMGMLPVTLIFVLTASLLVALIYTPILGGVSGGLSRRFEAAAAVLRARLPWVVRALLVVVALFAVFTGAMLTLNPGYLSGQAVQTDGLMASLPGIVLFLAGAMAASITLTAARIDFRKPRIEAGYRRSVFGWVIHAIVGNPVMPIVAIIAVGAFVVGTFTVYSQNNNGVEFFVPTEPEQAIVYVQARGNLSLAEKAAMVEQVEMVTLGVPGVDSVFAFAGEGGLNNNGGGGGPADAIGQLQVELTPWADREALALELGLDPASLTGTAILQALADRYAAIPAIRTEISNLAQGPASSKPVHLRLTGADFAALREATRIVRAQFDQTPGLTGIDDTLPLPGIDWQIEVDVDAAGRFGADVATVGAMVQLVTRGIFLDTMRVPTSDEEVEIRVRLPAEDRVLSTLDSLKVRTAEGLVPLSNFVTRTPVPRLAQIDRIDQERYYDVLAGVAEGLVKLTTVATGDVRVIPDAEADADPAIAQGVADGTILREAVNGNERVAALTAWLDTNPLPEGVSWEWTGDQADQAESQAFLMQAFAGALGLMFIILLAQFNSIYNSVLVLTAVVLSTVGVLIGMLVMDQTFSIIMTGTGIVALAGIVVNNNIILIDTYQDFSRYMPRLEAITRTAEARIRPVLLTTITTIAGLLPMMFGISFDFINGGYTVDSPSALWWKQLATAVVFGLAIATVLTLVVTPALLAMRVWLGTYIRWIGRLLARLSMGKASRVAQDWALAREAKAKKAPEFLWVEPALPEPAAPLVPTAPLRAAE
jgi:multidrug efflux pump